MAKVAQIIDIAKEMNDKGNKFTLWGTCLGFEELLLKDSNYKFLRTRIRTKNTNKLMRWVPENFEISDFKKVLRPEIADAMTKEPITYFTHFYGFSVKMFNSIPELKKEYNIVGYYEKNKKDIIAAIQHKRYPFYGVQFHPEKILFEHKLKVAVKLTKESAMASSELARIIFHNALENNNHFTN
jgi:gamma-glutamyl hydrolase